MEHLPLTLTVCLRLLLLFCVNLVLGIPFTIRDNKDGTYEVEFTPDNSGKHEISVGVPAIATVPGGELLHFAHSPFIANIDPHVGTHKKKKKKYRLHDREVLTVI